MKNIFKQTGYLWVKYNKYDWKKADDGLLYLMPCKSATLSIYDPMEKMENIILSAVNIGRMGMDKEAPDSMLQDEILNFTQKYGLLGLMTALPSTPKFMDYEAVYFHKNHFIKEETMATKTYVNKFYPFEKLDIIKRGKESEWAIENDNELIALTATLGKYIPMATNMSFHRSYAERYDWLKQRFIDFAFNVTSVFLYYKLADSIPAIIKEIMQQSISAYGSQTPTYYIVFKDKPTLMWNFNSLMQCIHMMLAVMITDEKQPLRLCERCRKPFITTRKNALYCSEECRKLANKEKK